MNCSTIHLTHFHNSIHILYSTTLHHYQNLPQLLTHTLPRTDSSSTYSLISASLHTLIPDFLHFQFHALFLHTFPSILNIYSLNLFGLVFFDIFIKPNVHKKTEVSKITTATIFTSNLLSLFTCSVTSLPNVFADYPV